MEQAGSACRGLSASVFLRATPGPSAERSGEFGFGVCAQSQALTGSTCQWGTKSQKLISHLRMGTLDIFSHTPQPTLDQKLALLLSSD